jgi:hypothetical protein
LTTYVHEKEILAFTAANYKKSIGKKGLSNTTLSDFFAKCFSDVSTLFGLYKCWICVACLAKGKPFYGWGDKPNACPKCGRPTYEVATFQARASHVGRAFQYACRYLLRESYAIGAELTGDKTPLYDLEIRPDLVIEAKGSPDSITNPDGSKSSIGRAGMSRSDTHKKAFANATEWKRRFPKGHFFILTNSLPASLRAYKDDKIDGIFDITKKAQLDEFVSEAKRLIATNQTD